MKTLQSKLAEHTPAQENEFIKSLSLPSNFYRSKQGNVSKKRNEILFHNHINKCAANRGIFWYVFALTFHLLLSYQRGCKSFK